MFWQVICCTLATAGVILFAWCLVGTFLLPVAGADLTTQYRVQGEATELEQTVRGFTWLRETGVIDMQLQIVDCGLTEAARRRAALLAQQHDYIQLTKEVREPPDGFAEHE